MPATTAKPIAHDPSEQDASAIEQAVYVAVDKSEMRDPDRKCKRSRNGRCGDRTCVQVDRNCDQCGEEPVEPRFTDLIGYQWRQAEYEESRDGSWPSAE